MEIDKIKREQQEKKKRAMEIERLLKSKKARWNLVSSELTELGKKYGDARRSSIKGGATELVYDAEAYVVHEDTTVVVTRDGWIKRVGEIKDPSSTRVREGDQARWILRGNTRDALALFSNFGVSYVLKMSNVPATTGYGEPVQSLLNFKDGERIIDAVLVVGNGSDRPEGAADGPRQTEIKFGGDTASKIRLQVVRRSAATAVTADRWLVASAGGMGFFCQPDLTETTKSGRRFARVKEGDEIILCDPASGDTITAATEGGKVLVFPAEELPELAGAGRGVILMRLDKGDRLIGAVCHPKDRAPIAVAEDGTERRFHLPETGRRAQKGRKALKRFKAAELVGTN